MYCLFCGASLSEDAPFCLKCGKPTPRGMSEASVPEDASTLAATFSPSDPYSPRPSTYYGPPPPEGETQSPYAPPRPYVPLAPPPPPKRRFSPGFLTGIFSGVLVVFLLSCGLGGWLLLKQETSSSSVPHALRPTVTARPTVQNASKPTATAQPTNSASQSLPGIWTQCAVENATCKFSGTMTVAFGANGSFHYATESNGTACTDAIFGDPLYGTPKDCYIEAAPPTTNRWVRCAAENATCSFLGAMTVAFGANGSFHYATETNGSACTTGVFGDPLYLTAKSCYLIAPPTSAATWHACAAENSTCSFTGRREVAYGTNGGYFYGSFTNGTVCSNSVFGDPAFDVVKSCYYQ